MADEKQESSPKPARDGSFQISISTDKMTAHLEISPPETGGKPVDLDDISRKITEIGVQGVDPKAVAEFVSAGSYGGPLVIARGMPPRNGEDGKAEFLVIDKARQKKGENELGRVDYHEYSSLVFAKKDEVLIRRTPPTAGVDGSDVFSAALKAVPGKDLAPAAGQNVVVSKDGRDYSAACAGHVSIQGSSISVEPVLVCEGDVDFKIGNIDFDGSVQVGGAIHEGFSVKATGDVVAQTVSKALIDAGRNVVIEKGIIGSPETLIKAKGSVSARFVENARVEAGKDVVVSEIILHSHVSAGRHVVVRGGKHACITGGRILAGACVEAHTIGAETATKTLIEIGLDPAVKVRLDALEKKISDIKESSDKINQELSTLTKLKERSKRLPPPKETRLLQLQAASQSNAADLRTFQNELADIKKRSATAQPGFVSVKEKIHRGSQISILDYSLTLPKDFTSTRFWLNRDKKEIGFSDFKEIDLG